jgi:hypothetical protein
VVDTETQGFVSRSSFLLRGSTSTFGEGVVSNHQRHERPPLFSDEPHPNGLDSPSTISATFEVEAGTFTTSSGHTSTTELEAPKYKQAVKTNQRQACKNQIKVRVSKETLELGGPQVNEGEMKISLGEDVNQGLLLRFSKDQ